MTYAEPAPRNDRFTNQTERLIGSLRIAEASDHSPEAIERKRAWLIKQLIESESRIKAAIAAADRGDTKAIWNELMCNSPVSGDTMLQRAAQSYMRAVREAAEIPGEAA